MNFGRMRQQLCSRNLRGHAQPGGVARERAVKTRSRMAIFSVLLLIFAKPLMYWAVVQTYA